MYRKLSLAFLLLLLCTSLAPAQEWASKMFKVRTHDFGAVARGAVSTYDFEIQNIYEEEIHIAGVRTSCGCTTPSITKQTLKTWEKGAIHAKFNTDSFLGHKSATITVTIDKPYYAEVQLSVRGNIRGDVVLEPGIVQFGSVEQGEAASAKVRVNYAGNSSWAITDIRSHEPHLGVEMREISRGGGRVGYELTVSLKENAPVGLIQTNLSVVANDGRSQSVAIPVEGKVNSAISVSPASLPLGDVKPGQAVEKKLIVRANRPFRVTGIQCKHDGFSFGELSSEPKKLHFIPVTFTADDKSGMVVQKILIETDLAPGANGEATATVVVTAPTSEQTALQ
ncbi:MAG: DUF1573 domain-containing protein [Pirellulaceae bacterium]